MSVELGYKTFLGWKIEKDDELFSIINNDFVEKIGLDASFDNYSGEFSYLGIQISYKREDNEDEDKMSIESLLEHYENLKSTIVLLNNEHNGIFISLIENDPQLISFNYWF